ncbi:MAG: glucuronate isomerase [Oscillospiraceae bacterium]|nr:glucuronate isomerase [Oscillospiraceae bacterium]
MKAFMDRDFLLSTDTAKHLYHDYAAPLPIIDYHCHLDPQEIYEDRQFENITQVWLGGDHYKWRLMRSAGVDEKYITGDASDREKFQKFAETVGLAIGNPIYHWSHLELRNYFGYEGTLNGDTAEEVWQLCNTKLQSADMSARKLIINSHVKALCTTDDPADTLEWHTKIAEDKSFSVKVLPSYRPDKALGIEKADYLDYLRRLGEIGSFAQLADVLIDRLQFFVSNGCRVSDHGMESVPYAEASEAEVEAIFRKRLSGEIPTAQEQKQFKTALLLILGREYHRLGVVMQLHFGVIRDNSQRVFRGLGPDAGIDSIGETASVKELAHFLNALDETGELPKTILYSLNPNDNTAIETVMGAFQTGEAVGKLQHGSAWWFNDHKTGMTEQMTSLANEGYLAGFVGMLTDSRSFLSYPRHEYFRRILCELIGSWVENGEYPNDEKALKKIVEGICVRNAEAYFDL